MSISAAFHKNVSLLIQAVPPSCDFQKYYKEGMFEKPNTAGFMYVSHYLLSIYDPDYMKKKIEWPVICKKTEAKYRNDVKEFLNVISNDNPDIGFPSIAPSLLLTPGGTKFMKVMWKLSQVAMREYIKRQSEHEVLFAPKRGAAEELTQMFIKNIINNINDNNLRFYTELLKTEEEARQYAKEEGERIKSTQKEIFEALQIASTVAAEAPVHPSFQKRLLDFDDQEIIQMWKKDLKERIAYCKKKVQILKTTEELSKTVFSMASNIISESTVFNANSLPKIDVNMISELPLPKAKPFLEFVYTNGNLNLTNYFLLFNTMMEYCGRCIRSNSFFGLCDHYSQIEASNADLKRMEKLFDDLILRMVQFSSEIQQKLEQPSGIEYNHTESSDVGSDFKNVMLMPSPPIQLHSTNGKNENQNRLKLTPVEGVHKKLFLKYNKNKDDSAINASRLRQNLIVTRINFDDTISSDIAERSPCRRFIPPKAIWSTCKPTGKYSRLFSNRSSQPINRVANCSMLSIPSNSKANSTAMNNIGDGNNAELTIDITMIEKKNTPKRSNKFFNIPETSADVNQKFFNVNAEVQVKSQKPCSPVTSPITCTREKGRRRSISDLVERYKRIVEKSVASTTQLKSAYDLSLNEESEIS